MFDLLYLPVSITDLNNNRKQRASFYLFMNYQQFKLTRHEFNLKVIIWANSSTTVRFDYLLE